jgi:hypothetical protein
MRYKLLMGFISLLLCAGYGSAQQVPNRALTYMEKEMYKTASTDGLGALYNNLKTEYDRRYFLLALPGYFAERKIQSATPAWVTTAILAGLQSKDPLCVHNAAVAAGMLKINCAPQLMACYKTVHNTFGSHEEMIKTAILGALAGMSDPEKQNFLYDVLTKDRYPLLSGTFIALLAAMETSKTTYYIPKLSAYSDSLDTIAIRIGKVKEQEYKVSECNAVKERINRLRNEIGGN